MVLDDDSNNRGQIDSDFTRHEFEITTEVTQQAYLSVSVLNGDIYPDRTGCADAYTASPLNAEYIVDSPDFLSTPYRNSVGGSSSFWFNNNEPVTLVAGETYTVNVELWGSNTRVARDFSIVGLGEQGAINFTSKQGLQSDHYFNSSCE